MVRETIGLIALMGSAMACSLSPLGPTPLSTASSSVAAVRSFDSARVVINIDSRVNGEGYPVSLRLPPGTYEVRPVGPSAGGAWEAWHPWGPTTCGDAMGCVMPAWPPRGVTGWMNAYAVLSPHLSSVSIAGISLAPVAVPPSREVQAVTGGFFLEGGAATRYHVFDNRVYPDAAAALAAAHGSAFVLDTEAAVGFSITDSELTDNRGGISLEIVRR